MHIAALTAPADEDVANEDWMSASPGLIIVLDGATVRTATGCSHGVAWYTTQLGSALAAYASDRDLSLASALGTAIQHVAALHPACDLTHPGTPSAAVAVLRLKNDAIEHLVLGDVAVVLDTTSDVRVVVDNRVDSTASAERRAANQYPIGSTEKQAALQVMKYAELAERNRPGGYWIAAAAPEAATHAITGAVAIAAVSRLAVLTDGAARLITPFGHTDWPELLDVLDTAGPAEVLRRVRTAEATDPTGRQFPRNKRSDDATIVYARLRTSPASASRVVIQATA